MPVFNIVELSGHQTHVQGGPVDFMLETPVCLQSLGPRRHLIMPPCCLQNGLLLYIGETQMDYGYQATLGFAGWQKSSFGFFAPS